MAKDSGSKIGSGHAQAMFRAGLRELRNAVYPESNVSNQVELGIWGTSTPQEITEHRRADAVEHEDESKSILSEKLRQAEVRRDPPNQGRDELTRE